MGERMEQEGKETWNLLSRFLDRLNFVPPAYSLKGRGEGREESTKGRRINSFVQELKIWLNQWINKTQIRFRGKGRQGWTLIENWHPDTTTYKLYNSGQFIQSFLSLKFQDYKIKVIFYFFRVAKRVKWDAGWKVSNIMPKIYQVFNKGEIFLHLSSWKNGKKGTHSSEQKYRRGNSVNRDNVHIKLNKT